MPPCVAKRMNFMAHDPGFEFTVPVFPGKAIITIMTALTLITILTVIVTIIIPIIRTVTTSITIFNLLVTERLNTRWTQLGRA